MNGRLGSFALAAGVYTVICSGSATPDEVITCNINLLNRTGTGINISLAHAAGGTPVDGEYFEDLTIPGHTPLERGGVVVGYGQNIIARAETAGINVVVWGFTSHE